MTPEQTEYFMAALNNLLLAASEGVTRDEEFIQLRDSELQSGLRLLWMGKESNGYVNFSHDEALILCGTSAKSTLRYHLMRLRNAGILRTYSTNGTVRAKVAGYPGSELIVHERSRTASTNSRTASTNSRMGSTDVIECSESREQHSRDRAAGQLLRAAGSRDRAAGQHYNRNFDDYPQGNHVVVVSSNTTPSVDGNLLTNYTPNALEQAQSVSILLDTDVRAKPKDAYRLSKQHSFVLIREAIAHWWNNRRSVGGKFDETPGIVTHWLDNLEGFSIPKLSAAFLQSDLYQRHRTKDEMDADLIESTPQLQPDQCDPEQEPEGSSDTWPDECDTWNNVLSQLESELPASTYKTWLMNTAAVIDEGTLTCTVCCENATTREWLSNRLRQMISRTINTVAQQRYHVQFEVRRRS